uniref:Uncharacterized protein n=1 Tax=Rhizophora mucronata TaxID=61149 RepID=A0A2P2Q744_RHIMU
MRTLLSKNICAKRTIKFKVSILSSQNLFPKSIFLGSYWCSAIIFHNL